MAGNVASMEAFVELAKTGVDYIRVGIGGGGGCNTTSNTGVGQEDLFYLVERCYERRKREQNVQKGCFEEGLSKYLTRNGVSADYHNEVFLNSSSIAKVKIVADGISSYIKQCETKYGFNDNGYAAINKLLFAGADLVMIGKLFAQCVESAGIKRYGLKGKEYNWKDSNYQLNIVDGWIKEHYYREKLEVKYSGMSTQMEQKNYRSDVKPSEGSVQWLPVRWTLNEWLNGSANQDEAPYLMGWINSIKSVMAYTGKTKLK